MKQLSPEQRDLVSSLATRLAAIRGVQAVVLGGSHARGRARPESDIDLGVFYSETAPFAIQDIRELAESVNDTPGPVVTDFYGWGPWVNGGAWLTIGDQRVDFLYRNLEHVERVACEVGQGIMNRVAGGVPGFQPFVRYNRFGDSSIDFTMILRAREFADNFLVKHEFIKALARRFADEGIVIPFPIRAINTTQESPLGAQATE